MILSDNEMKKRNVGQLQIGFGMIFSIIIIIFTIAVAFYVISYFIKLGRCTDVSLFYSDLEERIDKAWASPITKDVYIGKLPNGIESVCFGNLTSVPEGNKVEYESLKKYRNQNANVFLYPLTKSCSNSVPYFYIQHAETEEFFCVKVISNKAKISIMKDSGDVLVKIVR